MERAVLREITQTLETEPKAPGQLGPTVLARCTGVNESSQKGELLPKPTSHQELNRWLLGGHTFASRHTGSDSKPPSGTPQ